MERPAGALATGPLALGLSCLPGNITPGKYGTMPDQIRIRGITRLRKEASGRAHHRHNPRYQAAAIALWGDSLQPRYRRASFFSSSPLFDNRSIVGTGRGRRSASIGSPKASDMSTSSAAGRREKGCKLDRSPRRPDAAGLSGAPPKSNSRPSLRATGDASRSLKSTVARLLFGRDVSASLKSRVCVGHMGRPKIKRLLLGSTAPKIMVCLLGSKAPKIERKPASASAGCRVEELESRSNSKSLAGSTCGGGVGGNGLVQIPRRFQRCASARSRGFESDGASRNSGCGQ